MRALGLLTACLSLGGCYLAPEPVAGTEPARDGGAAGPCSGPIGRGTLVVGEASTTVDAAWLDVGLGGRVRPWLYLGDHAFVRQSTDSGACGWTYGPDGDPARIVAMSFTDDAERINEASLWECLRGECDIGPLGPAEVSLHLLDVERGELCADLLSETGDGRPVRFSVRAALIGRCAE